MRPSDNNGNTEKHDRLHIWLSNESNLKALIQHIFMLHNPLPPKKEREMLYNKLYKRSFFLPDSIYGLSTKALDCLYKRIVGSNPSWNKESNLQAIEDKLAKNPTLYNLDECIAEAVAKANDIDDKLSRARAVFNPELNVSLGKPKHEMPVFSGTFLQGIVDCFVEIHCQYIYKAELDGLKVEYGDSKAFGNVLIEFKPEMKSISQLLGQVNAYKNLLRDVVYCVLLTYDSNKEYDKFLATNGIDVFRVPTDITQSQF